MSITLKKNVGKATLRPHKSRFIKCTKVVLPKGNNWRIFWSQGGQKMQWWDLCSEWIHFDTLGRMEWAGEIWKGAVTKVQAWRHDKGLGFTEWQWRGASRVTFQDEPRSTQSCWWRFRKVAGVSQRFAWRTGYMVARLNRNDETGLKVQIFEGAKSKGRIELGWAISNNACMLSRSVVPNSLGLHRL